MLPASAVSMGHTRLRRKNPMNNRVKDQERDAAVDAVLNGLNITPDRYAGLAPDRYAGVNRHQSASRYATASRYLPAETGRPNRYTAAAGGARYARATGPKRRLIKPLSSSSRPRGGHAGRRCGCPSPTSNCSTWTAERARP